MEIFLFVEEKQHAAATVLMKSCYVLQNFRNKCFPLVASSATTDPAACNRIKVISSLNHLRNSKSL